MCALGAAAAAAGADTGAGTGLGACVCFSCSAGAIDCVGCVECFWKWVGIRGEAAADPTVGVKGDAVGVGGAGMIVGTGCVARGGGADEGADDVVGMAVAGEAVVAPEARRRGAGATAGATVVAGVRD